MKLSNLMAGMVLSLFSLTSCDIDDICIKASGDSYSEEYEISSFTKVKLDFTADVKIYQGDTQTVEVIAQERVHENIKTNVVDGTWTIDSDICFRKHDDVQVIITLPTLSEVVNDGVGNIDVFEFDSLTHLNATLDGTGNIFLSGSVQNLILHHDGVGDINAFGMNSETAIIGHDGVGDIDVSVSDQLTIIHNGVGDIRYNGSPDTSIDNDGVGSVTQL